jgi:hypothetical protein
MVKQWGRKCDVVGIRGTIALMIVYAMTRVPNPITSGRALSISGIGIATEIFQAALIITGLIIAKERTIHASQRQELR